MWKTNNQSRTALLWCLASFVFLQLGLAVAIERWLPVLRDPEYGYRAARLYSRTVSAPDRPLTVVMLGSSRTTRGFNAARLEQSVVQTLGRPAVVFNFGITGAGPLRQLLDLRRLLAEGIRPDVLLVEVLPPFLAEQASQAELDRLPVTQLWSQDLPILERYGGSAREMWTAWWQSRPLPWYVHRYALLGRTCPDYLPHQLRIDWLYKIDNSGWFANPVRTTTEETHRLAVARTRQEYVGYLTGFRLGARACQALSELLDLCRSQAMTVALVLMPEGPEFRSWYSPQAWTQIDSFLRGLSREYALPVINAREWVAEEYFSDSHHLLPRGADLFTDRLGREALLPLIKKKPDTSLKAELVFSAHDR